MTDSTLAACRAALLKACRAWPTGSGQREYVNVDDAAACMAEREAKLWAAPAGSEPVEQIRAAWKRNEDVCLDVGSLFREIDRLRAALAAAQEVDHDKP